MASRDIWSDWLLERRFGGDAVQLKRLMDLLAPVRDRVLAGAALKDGETLLDVGCGDGLIAFGALQAQRVVDAAHKLKAQTRSLQPPESDPMLNFDERDLLRMVQDAGFTEVEMDYEARITRWPETEWSALINQAPNPKLPTWAEAMDQVLTPAEKEAFIAHVRPQVEQRQAIEKLAHVFLRGTKT